MGQWGACYGEHEILCIPHRYSSAWLAGVRCERPWPFSLNVPGETQETIKTANRYARDRTTRQRAVVVNSIMKRDYGNFASFTRRVILVLLLLANENKFWTEIRTSRCCCKQVSRNEITETSSAVLASFTFDALSFHSPNREWKEILDRDTKKYGLTRQTFVSLSIVNIIIQRSGCLIL